MFGYTVELTNAEMFVVDAFQTYSQSGKSMIYDFNTCYTPANPYDIEIDQTYNYTNPGCDAAEGSLCVKVPGFASGFVKMQVVPYIPRIANEIESELIVYPNPANDKLNISFTEDIHTVVILSVTGMKILEQTGNNNSVDISQLSYGMYQVFCYLNDGSQMVKSFIKL